MKKAALMVLSTCLFFTLSAATASASTESSHNVPEHKMHAKEHKIREHKLHVKEHKAHVKKLHAKQHKTHAKSIKPHALPKTGYGGVSE